MNLARGVQRAACQRAATSPLASATFWRGATSLGDLYESPVLSRLFDPILGVQSPACEFNPMRSSTRAASLCATRLSRGSLAQRGRLRSRASKLRTVTSLWGEHSAAEGGKWDISNKQRIGFSEVQLVQKMIDGVSKVIELEEMLAAGASTAQVEALLS